MDHRMARGGAVLGLLVMALFTGCVISRTVSTAPPPAALPAAVAAPSQRALAYPHGQWILRGAGTTRSPYAWVWMPAGLTPPPRR
jgi:hypothetical protein